MGKLKLLIIEDVAIHGSWSHNSLKTVWIPALSRPAQARCCSDSPQPRGVRGKLLLSNPRPDEKCMRGRPDAGGKRGRQGNGKKMWGQTVAWKHLHSEPPGRPSGREQPVSCGGSQQRRGWRGTLEKDVILQGPDQMWPSRGQGGGGGVPVVSGSWQCCFRQGTKASGRELLREQGTASCHLLSLPDRPEARRSACLCTRWLGVAWCREEKGKGSRDGCQLPRAPLRPQRKRLVRRDFVAREFLGQRFSIRGQGGLWQERRSPW